MNKIILFIVICNTLLILAFALDFKNFHIEQKLYQDQQLLNSINESSVLHRIENSIKKNDTVCFIRDTVYIKKKYIIDTITVYKDTPFTRVKKNIKIHTGDTIIYRTLGKPIIENELWDKHFNTLEKSNPTKKFILRNGELIEIPNPKTIKKNID